MPWTKTPEDRHRDAAIYGSPEYRRNRAVARRRSGGRCEGCGHKHTRLECDHIRNAAAGDTPDHSLGNLRMLCVGPGSCKCHEKKTAQEGNDGRTRSGRQQRDPPAQQRTHW
jgi:hypothetical protein